MTTSWMCPQCQSRQVITDAAHASGNLELRVSPLGHHGISADLVCCADPECGGYELMVRHGERRTIQRAGGRHYSFTAEPETSRLVPSSRARAYPHYIPVPIREDYEEACAIEQASPKASATLARRALQGMIRDFWGIEESNLAREIEALRSKPEVPSETLDATDALRKVGNIGAHMERDINTIIDVEPNEATALIGLIEMLIEEWYVARHRRQERLKLVKQIGDKKDAARGDSTTPV